MNELRITEIFNGYYIELSCGEFFLPDEHEVQMFLQWYSKNNDVTLTMPTILELIDKIKLGES